MKNSFKISSLILMVFALSFGAAQTAPFEISIEEVTIPGLGGLQSYAFAQDNGKWLIVGGRLDGLHRRQPWAAFDLAGHNNQLLVVDPQTREKWSAPLTSLPLTIQEQLSATNSQFYQEGNYLYILGGYGYSDTEGDHITYPYLTAIHIPDVISSVINNTAFSGSFRQIMDNEFQVTGGRLKKIDNTFYLMGGQKFIGRYNPMGPTHGPGFVQEYTDAIRPFTLMDDGTTISITHLIPFIDNLNLHRRDYNAEAQILPNGAEGITMFSGVFQQGVDLPFLNSVTINASGYAVNNNFEQYYNHYHCPVLPIYSESNNEMHTIFFGGIAQFYDLNGVLTQDDDVPFVNTIARVTRDEDGNMLEYKLPIEMPTLLGAGGEFIPNLNFPHFNNDVFKLDSLSMDSTLIGYIYGGINSSDANIFFINDGTQSSSSSQIFKVYLKKSLTLSLDQLNQSSTSSLDLRIYPNPADSFLDISFYLLKKDDVKISIFDTKGTLVDRFFLKKLPAGENHIKKNLANLSKGNIYLISIESSTEKSSQRLLMK